MWNRVDIVRPVGGTWPRGVMNGPVCVAIQVLPTGTDPSISSTRWIACSARGKAEANTWL
jgi:hypothetical protein